MIVILRKLMTRNTKTDVKRKENRLMGGKRQSKKKSYYCKVKEKIKITEQRTTTTEGK